MVTKQDNYFQALRAVAIIAVVLIHSAGAGIRPIEDNETLEIIFRQFINYAVPMFLFISGYFVNKDAISSATIVKKLKRLLIPYFLWSGVGIVLAWNFGLKHLIYTLLTGQAMAQLYFIVVFAQLVILTPLIVKTLGNKKLTVLMLLITPAFLVGCYSYYYISNRYIGFPYNALPFITWLMFYYLGILCKNSPKTRDIITKYIGLACLGYVVGIFLSIFEGLSIYHFDSSWFGFATSQIKISSFLTSFFLIWIAMYLHGKIQIRSRLLVYIGNNSFGIFFIHILVMRLVSKTGVLSNITNQVAYATLNAAITIGVSLLLIFLAKKALGEKVSRSYLGF